MEKDEIEHPFKKTVHKYVFILFGIEVLIILICFFLLNGYTFFETNSVGEAIIISLGLLTFISVFFAFVFKDSMILLLMFSRNMEECNDSVLIQLKKKIDSKTLEERDLMKVKEIRSAIKEYSRYVNPVLWFFATIFLSLVIILMSMSKVEYSALMLSAFVHLDILTTLFFITSIMALMIYKPKRDS
jgi:glutaredoxin-related protein